MTIPDFIEKWNGLLKSEVAKKYKSLRYYQFDDLYNEAVIYIYKNYDRFSKFHSEFIKNAVWNAYKTLSRTTHGPAVSYNTLNSTGRENLEVIEDKRIVPYLERLELQEQVDAANAVLIKLKEKNPSYYYVLKRISEYATPREIANDMGISRKEVYNTIQRAKTKVKSYTRRNI